MGLYQEFRSWQKVANYLSSMNGHTFNKGMLQQVANGKRRAPNSILHVLGLPLNPVPAQPCPKCGNVPLTKRCPTCRKKPQCTPEEQQAAQAERERRRLAAYVLKYNG